MVISLTGGALTASAPEGVEAESGSYNLRVGGLERTELFASITNVFDKDPPFSGNNGFGVGGVNAAFFDALGHTYRVGLRMEF